MAHMCVWSPPVSEVSASAVRLPPGDSAPQNLLLSALPQAEYRKLLPDLRRVTVQRKETVHHPGELLEFVYFPNSGVFSITTELPDGRMVEAATVGAEGMLGIEAFLGRTAIAPGRILLQVPEFESSTASALRLRADVFRQVSEERGALYDIMGRYAQTVLVQMMQSAACNALHPVNDRCARWLLQTHDRMHRGDFHLSHEFLAVMLGVQRSTVTVVAGALQARGLITYSHGHVHVVDREGLEDASCMCYAVIREHFDALHVRPNV
jgi:CRP-like cAMP-binding protein